MSTFSEYMSDAASLADDFVSGLEELVSDIPDASGALADSLADFSGASATFISEASASAFVGVVDAASLVGDVAGEIVSNPLDFNELSDWYSSAWGALSLPEFSDVAFALFGVGGDSFVYGNGGTSGGAGASGSWPVPVWPSGSPPRYPAGVVYPPFTPEPVPVSPAIARIVPKVIPPPERDCLHRRFPRIGEIIYSNVSESRLSVVWVENFQVVSWRGRGKTEGVISESWRYMNSVLPSFILDSLSVPSGAWLLSSIERGGLASFVPSSVSDLYYSSWFDFADWKIKSYLKPDYEELIEEFSFRCEDIPRECMSSGWWMPYGGRFYSIYSGVGRSESPVFVSATFHKIGECEIDLTPAFAAARFPLAGVGVENSLKNYGSNFC